VLGRVLDADTPAVVRHQLPTVTIARLTTNAAYRYAPPFLATIARGLDVSVAEMGIALAVTDLCGLSSPLIGRLVDRLARRASMWLGLATIGVGTALAAASTGVVMFTVALMTVSLAKIVFDVGLGAWIADHVPFARRSRIVGITETSWALGLLVGVSTLGVVTALSSWRVAYAVASVAVVAMAAVVARRMPRERAAGHATGGPGPVTRLTASGWCAVVGMFGLMSAAQTLFITFGPWLEDEYGFGGLDLAVVTFGLGAIELAASTTSAARTDRWGKERSVVAGTMIMAPAALALVLLSDHLAAGLVLLAVFMAGFEFAIVSALPIGAELVPGSPGRGIGTMIAFGTVGRAVSAVPATRLFDEHGLAPAAILGAAAAVVGGAGMYARGRLAAAGR
jgi:DHA1 family inner membrane transport protein